MWHICITITAQTLKTPLSIVAALMAWS